MLSGSVIFYKIASMCLLIFFGYVARRMKLVPENSLNVMSHFILDIATPCYILSYLPRTINAETIGQYWHYPLLAVGLLAFSDIIGLGAARIFALREKRPTFRLLVALPNWMFLALAVCEPLFGASGVRVVLLFNVGVTAYIWSFGMTGFRKGIGWDVVKNLFLNMQIIATIVGVFLALTTDFLAGAHSLSAAELSALPAWLGGVASVWEAVVLLGFTALPLNIFQIGLRLAGSEGGKTVEELAEKCDNRSLALVVGLRLVVAPLLTVGLLLILSRLGLGLAYEEYLVAVIIFSMPVAVVCMGVTDVYGGDTLLTARAVLWTTLASMGTVPLISWFADLLGKEMGI